MLEPAVRKYGELYPMNSVMVLATIGDIDGESSRLGLYNGYPIEEAELCWWHLKELMESGVLDEVERAFLADELAKLVNEARKGLPQYHVRTKQKDT